MKNKREIPCEIVVGTMEILNGYEKKLECMVDFIGDLKRPTAPEYPEPAGITASYESATEDAERLSQHQNRRGRGQRGRENAVKQARIARGGGVDEVESVKVDEVFGEKCANLSKGYQDLKICCNKMCLIARRLP